MQKYITPSNPYAEAWQAAVLPTENQNYLKAALGLGIILRAFQNKNPQGLQSFDQNYDCDTRVVAAAADWLKSIEEMPYNQAVNTATKFMSSVHKKEQLPMIRFFEDLCSEYDSPAKPVFQLMRQRLKNPNYNTPINILC